IHPALLPVPAAALCVDPGCAAHGLTETRFANPNLSGTPVSTRVQPEAAMAWQGEQRVGSTRWTGYIAAPESGEYRFRFDANGGYRIWVDDRLVVDAWHVDWRPSIATGTIALE